MSTLETRIAEVLAAHSIGAFSGDSTACQCDRTWRKNADHRKHLTEALAAALAPVVTSSNASAWHEGFNDGKRQDAEGDDGPRFTNPYRSNDDHR